MSYHSAVYWLTALLPKGEEEEEKASDCRQEGRVESTGSSSSDRERWWQSPRVHSELPTGPGCLVSWPEPWWDSSQEMFSSCWGRQRSQPPVAVCCCKTSLWSAAALVFGSSRLMKCRVWTLTSGGAPLTCFTSCPFAVTGRTGAGKWSPSPPSSSSRVQETEPAKETRPSGRGASEFKRSGVFLCESKPFQASWRAVTRTHARTHAWQAAAVVLCFRSHHPSSAGLLGCGLFLRRPLVWSASTFAWRRGNASPASVRAKEDPSPRRWQPAPCCCSRRSGSVSVQHKFRLFFFFVFLLLWWDDESWHSGGFISYFFGRKHFTLGFWGVFLSKNK